jgi:hypothetical protein
LGFAAALLFAGAASAQVIPPGGSQFNPPLPARAGAALSMITAIVECTAV